MSMQRTDPEPSLPYEAEGNICFGVCEEVKWTQFIATLAACHSILFMCACDIMGSEL